MRGDGETTVETVVWDLPTRLFHWALAACLVGSFVTVQAHDMRTHALFGYAALALVLFRIVWGLIGSESARFASFVRGPLAVARYVRGLAERAPDRAWTHNPLGGWAVVALLGLVLAQATTGLFANNDIVFRGPLFPIVGKELSDRLTVWHYRISDALLILVAVHVIAVLVYRFVLGHDLITAMVTGRKRLPGTVPPPRRAKPLAAAVAFAAAVVAVWAVVSLGG